MKPIANLVRGSQRPSPPVIDPARRGNKEWCPLCGEYSGYAARTRKPEIVPCQLCWDTYYAGKRLETLEAESEETEEITVEIPKVYHLTSEEWRDVSVRAVERHLESMYPQIWKPRQGRRNVLAPKAHRLKELCQLIGKLCAYERTQGQVEGSSIINMLATGRASVDDYNAFHEKARER